MCIVVLDLNERKAELLCKLTGDRGRVVTRMPVAGYHLRRSLEEVAHPLHRFPQGLHGPHVLGIAYVRRRIEELVPRDTECVFQFASHGQDVALRRHAHHERKRSISARAPYHVRPAPVKIHHRIVGSEAYQPVVAEYHVAHTRELAHGVFIISADRGSRHITARHHEAVRHAYAVRVVEEQHLDRRVREHHSNGRVVRRDPRGQPRVIPAALSEQHYRLLVAVDYLFLVFLNDALPADRVKVSHHHGKWFCRTRLEVSQPLHRSLISCIAAEVESSYALYSDYASAAHDTPYLRDGRSALSVLRQLLHVDRELISRTRRKKIDLRSAVVAADRLGVVAPRLGVGVFVLALRAHRKVRHAGPHPVVRHTVEYGRSRTARGAVYERMQVAPVGLVEELLAALFAGRDVGRHEDLAQYLLALDDPEVIVLAGVRGSILPVELEYYRSFRRVMQKIVKEGVDVVCLALRVDLDIRALVAHAALYAVTVREPVNRRPEADALHYSVYSCDLCFLHLLIISCFACLRSQQCPGYSEVRQVYEGAFEALRCLSE